MRKSFTAAAHARKASCRANAVRLHALALTLPYQNPCMCDRKRRPRLVEQVEVVGDQHAHQRPRDARLACAPNPRAFSLASTAQARPHPSLSTQPSRARRQAAAGAARGAANEWSPVSSSTMVTKEHSPAASVQRCSLSSCRIRLLHAHQSAPAARAGARNTRRRQHTLGGAGQRGHPHTAARMA